MSDPVVQEASTSGAAEETRLRNVESQVASLTQGMANIEQLLQTALQTARNLPPERAAPAPAPVPLAVPPPDAPTPFNPGFVPPASANPAAGASSSLLSQFPQVEAAVLTAIINHEFRASDLYKLDPQYRDKADRRVLAINGDTLELQSGEATAKEYRSVNSVIIPLGIYFSILGAAIASQNAATNGAIITGFWAYSNSISQFASEYNWTAVSAYHTDFFTARRREMQSGDYSRWGRIDSDIQSRRLFGHTKAARPVAPPSSGAKQKKSGNAGYCMKYNAGQCQTTPCPWGRPHTCSSCGQNHPLTEHK